MVFKKNNIPWNLGLKGFKTKGSFKQEHKVRLGMKHSEETKRILSMKAKKRIMTEETKNKISKSLKNVIHNKDWNNKVSKSLTGRKHTEEHRKNNSLAKLGKSYEERFGKERAEIIKHKFSLQRAGEKNNNWHGGISFKPYDKTFNNKFKRAIRKRDNHICMMCGIHKEKYYRAFDVHHINYDKLLSIPQNCISLCKNCHGLAQTNRKYWIKFFQNLLSDRYGYNYNINNEIMIKC